MTPLTDHLEPGQFGSRRSSCRHIRSLSSLARDAEPARRHRVFRTISRTWKLPRHQPAWTVEGVELAAPTDIELAVGVREMRVARRFLRAAARADIPTYHHAPRGRPRPTRRPGRSCVRGDPIALMRSRLVNDLLHVVDDRQWIKIEGLIVHDGNDPRDDGTRIVGGVSSYVRHEQHCQHGATNRFRPPQPSCVSDPRPGTAWWLWNRNRVMRGRPM